jgi:hypothetical protein
LVSPITSEELAVLAPTDAEAFAESRTLLENIPIVLATRAAEASPRTPKFRFINPPVRL